VKNGANYEIHRSLTDSFLSLFFLTHVTTDRVVEPIPMQGVKYTRIIRFTVWAQKCREAGLHERNRMVAEYTAVASKEAELRAQIAVLQSALAEKAHGADKSILKRIEGEPSTANLDGWKEFLTTPSQVDALMHRLDVAYGLPSDSEKRTARENLRSAIISALSIDTPDWTKENAGYIVHNLLCSYRVVMKVVATARESVFAKMEPHHVDALGTLIDKANTSNNGGSKNNNAFVRKAKKCFFCKATGHTANECFKKQAKNARKEE